MGLLYRENGFDILKDIVKRQADFFSQTTNKSININDKILLECYTKAKETAKLHNIDFINHYKEAAHICYWIRTLKPLSIVNDKLMFEKIKTILKKFLDDSIDEIDSIDEEINSIDDKKIEKEYPINEHVSLYTAFIIIGFC